jgi:hypothetical protein
MIYEAAREAGLSNKPTIRRLLKSRMAAGATRRIVASRTNPHSEGNMGFVPEGAEWYLAQVVIEFVVEGDARNVVHVNYLLVRAQSPDEAYQKALRL